MLEFFNHLRDKTREQLLTYPNLNFKNQVKYIVKSIMGRRLSFRANKYSWPNGLLAIALEWSHRATNEDKDLNRIMEYYDNWINEGMKISTIDQAINGYTLIYLHQKTGIDMYKKAADKIYDYLVSYSKSFDGDVPYRKGNASLILVDAIGMICPFLSRYGSTYNNTYATDIAINEMVKYIEKGIDNITNLPYHGYNLEDNKKIGIIGWGRALGWLLIGIIDSLEYIPKSHCKYEQLVNSYTIMVNATISKQKEDGSFSWQISALDGYSDTSATSMISYAIKRGMMLGILDTNYSETITRALNSLHKATNQGLVMGSSAECIGVSMYPQVYGTYPWSQGPTTSLVALNIISGDRQNQGGYKG